MASPHDDGDADLGTVQRRFGEFAATHPGLTLYADLCRHVASDEATASLLLEAQPGQERPVLWLAALHDLVLRRPDVPAARWYAAVSQQGSLLPGDPWPDVRETVLAHEAELRAVIASRTTQTNEVNRTAYLAPCLAAAARATGDLPVVLVEMGASAGLLLNVDRYRTDLVADDGRATTFGSPASSVRCQGTDRSPRATRELRLPTVAGRLGLDLHPVEDEDHDALRWLEACLWPDVPGRLGRFRAAVAVLREHPPVLRRGDMVADLLQAVSLARNLAATHTVVFSSWALTYVERERRPDVATVLETVAQQGGAVSWLTAEPPGCAPGIDATGLTDEVDTVLGLRRWRGGAELPPVVLGSCHPHGEWVDLAGGESTRASSPENL